MIDSQAAASKDHLLTNAQIIETIQAGLKNTLHHRRGLVLIPDHTRSLPSRAGILTNQGALA